MAIYRTRTTFTLQLKHSFSCFTINKLFKDPKTRIIVGHEDGMVRTYDIPESDTFLQNPAFEACYETKGGPIQAVLVEDLTNLLANDLIVGNSRGEVTFFCKGQIMARCDIFDHCITNMILVKDAAGTLGIVACDSEGTMCFFDLYNEAWRIRHAEGKLVKELQVQRKVTCVFHAVLNTAHGSKAGYVLVADDSKRLSFYCDNHLVLVLTTPAVVTAMCAGRFVEEDHFEGAAGNTTATKQGPSSSSSSSSSSPYGTQVILGSDDGSLRMMADYQVFSDEIVNVQFPVRHLCRLPGGRSPAEVDLVVAAGNADCYCIIRRRKEVVRHRTSSWVTSMLIKDVDNDGQDEIVYSCKDLSIHAHKLFNN